MFALHLADNGQTPANICRALAYAGSRWSSNEVEIPRYYNGLVVS